MHRPFPVALAGKTALSLHLLGFLGLLASAGLPSGAHAAPPFPDRRVLLRSEHAFATALPPEILNALRAERVSYGYDVQHVDLALTVNFALPEIVAVGTMDVEITQAGLASLVVDLNNTLVVTGATVGGAARPWAQAAETVTVNLAAPPPVGSIVRVAIAYHGRPLEIGTKSMRFRQHLGTPVVYTLSTPFSNAATTVIPISHYWRPCKDDPTDKSTYSCAIRVPSTMTACSNGVLTSEVDNLDGTKTYSWEHGYPIAPYLITIGVTNYVRLDGTYVGPTHTLAIHNFAWPEDQAAATSDWAAIPGQLGVFESLYGEYPFTGEKFGLYQIAPGPAVEHQTMVSFPDNLIDGTGQWDWVIAHEMSHMWWGDLVTVSDWAHVWLAEGAASYSEALYRESSGGAAALEAYMVGLDEGPYDGTVVSPPFVWHDIVYNQGAWVHHMLRHILGDGPYFGMLASYRAAHAYGNVTTSDLIAAAEAAYGGSLGWFFTPWLFQSGRPEYRFSWQAGAVAPSSVELELHQVQAGTQPTYAMFIDVEVTTSSGSELHRIYNDLRDQTFTIPVAASPISVELDPHHWVMARFTEAPIAVATATPSIGPVLHQNHPNPVRAATRIELDVRTAGVAALRLFDARGRLVRTLFRGALPAGRRAVDWDGKDENGDRVAPGVYFYRFAGPDGVAERRLVVAP